MIIQRSMARLSRTQLYIVQLSFAYVSWC